MFGWLLSRAGPCSEVCFQPCVAPGRQMPLGTFCSRSRCPHGRQGSPTNSHPEHTTVSKAWGLHLLLALDLTSTTVALGSWEDRESCVTVTGPSIFPSYQGLQRTCFYPVPQLPAPGSVVPGWPSGSLSASGESALLGDRFQLHIY